MEKSVATLPAEQADDGMEEFKQYTQEAALEFLPDLEAAFKAGDRFALFQAISECALHDLALPDWVATAFLEGYYSVINFRSGSWDDAFGRPYKKGLHVDQARTRRESRLKVFLCARQILSSEPNLPIDEDLFERVGRECGVSRSVASQLYYQHKRHMESTFPGNP